MIVASIRSAAENDNILLVSCIDCIDKFLMAVEQYKAQRDDINALLGGPFDSLFKFC